MIAAQLLAAHNAAMECYRRAMLDEQTFEGRPENLSQANKLSQPTPSCSMGSIATAARASKRSRSSTSTSMPAVRLSSVSSNRPKGIARNPREKAECRPSSCRCTGHCVAVLGPGAGARADRRRCAANAAVGCTGGAAGSGAPMGNKNALRYGQYTAEAIAERRAVAALIRSSRATLADFGNGR